VQRHAPALCPEDEDLTVNAIPAAEAFIPIRQYRQLYSLPDAFSVSLFAPKDFAGLGHIDSAGAALNATRTEVLRSVPAVLRLPDALEVIASLTSCFETALYAINDQVGLHDVEIEFASGGFSDICHAWWYATLAAAGQHPPSFATIYRGWLASTCSTAPASPYSHEDETWQVEVVYHAYGRMGLCVRRGDETDWVRDASLGCPAEGFMFTLMNDVCEALTAAYAGAQAAPY
jgi:hypothetical protein